MKKTKSKGDIHEISYRVRHSHGHTKAKDLEDAIRMAKEDVKVKKYAHGPDRAFSDFAYVDEITTHTIAAYWVDNE